MIRIFFQYGLHHSKGKLVSFWREEDGKITLFAIPWVFGLGFMLCFVGNSGEIVAKKLQAQNAADATAYSLALIQARGLNTVTSINHVMGDITALNVTLDALGGPELDENWQNKIVDTKESSSLISTIKEMTTGEVRACYGDRAPLVPPFQIIEKEFLKQIGKTIYETKEYATAAIYDGRMLIKSHVALILTNKAIITKVAFLLSQIKPYLAWVDPASIVVHCGLDVILIQLVKEWLVLEAMEKGCALMKPFKEATRSAALPLLSRINDKIAGQIGNSPVQESMKETIKTLESDYRMDKIAVFPSIEDIRLPTRREKPPAEDPEYSKLSEKPDSDWDGTIDLGGGGIISEMSSKINIITDKIKTLKDTIDGIAKDVLPGWAKKALKDMDGLDDIQRALTGIGPKQKYWPQNPSQDQLPKFNWVKEKKTQWVRASMPPLDQYRAVLRKTLNDSNPISLGAPISNTGYFFSHWSNKYILKESFYLRSGKYFKSGTENSTLNIKELNDLIQKLKDLRQKFDAATVGPNDQTYLEIKKENVYVSFIKKILDLSQEAETKLSSFGSLGNLIAAWIKEVKDSLLTGGILDNETAKLKAMNDPVAKNEMLQSFMLDAIRIREIDRLLRKIDRLLEELDDLKHLGLEPPHMQIMVDSTPDTKGKEPWWSDRGLFEERFCLLVGARKTMGSGLYLPGLYFRKGSDIECFAQAVVYNANEPFLLESGPFQPNPGWDTLNWGGKDKVPEASGYLTESADGNLPEIFNPGSLNNQTNRSIQLNWQGKLVPISIGMVEQAQESVQTNQPFYQGLGRLGKHFPLSTY